MFGLLKDVVGVVAAPVVAVAKTARAVEREVTGTVDDVLGLKKGTTQTVTDVVSTGLAVAGAVSIVEDLISDDGDGNE